VVTGKLIETVEWDKPNFVKQYFVDKVEAAVAPRRPSLEQQKSIAAAMQKVIRPTYSLAQAKGRRRESGTQRNTPGA